MFVVDVIVVDIDNSDIATCGADLICLLVLMLCLLLMLLSMLPVMVLKLCVRCCWYIVYVPCCD